MNTYFNGEFHEPSSRSSYDSVQTRVQYSIGITPLRCLHWLRPLPDPRSTTPEVIHILLRVSGNVPETSTTAGFRNRTQPLSVSVKLLVL